MRDIGVVNDPTGRPVLALTGGAARRLQFLLPEGMVASIHLTLTDEPPCAFAGVLIEALPARPVKD
jgi:holo-[acyl-carrier protein] synthase